MDIMITTDHMHKLGIDAEAASVLTHDINAQLKICVTAGEAWAAISKNLTLNHYPFAVHLFVFNLLFPNWHDHPELAPAWFPSPSVMANANISTFMSQLNIADVQTLHDYSVKNYRAFWTKMLTILNIALQKKPDEICDLTHGVETIRWLPNAKMNIAESCFQANENAIAIIFKDVNGQLQRMSYGELNTLSNRVAASLVAQGLDVGDAIGIAMPMNVHAIAIYLGIIKMGGVVVSIADSFSAEEMAMRFDIVQVQTVFTQDTATWAGKKLELYKKLQMVAPKQMIVVAEHETCADLRANDLHWQDFLSEKTDFNAIARDPMDACNILFSSGTTATPKAIVWSHVTPIKSASDAYFHQDIHAGDVLAWPTSLGWMMGPWLVFAALINQASIALYPDAPKDEAFGQFVADAKVTMLGVVPTLVSAWRQSKCMEKVNWKNIRVFSSTGECSNAEDMLYLMYLANYKPVIEYCGGTEIGGSYVSSTVIQENYPSLFSTQVIGVRFVLLDENGTQSDCGEVALVPPSLGLSTTLLNANHHQAYFAGMPLLDGNPLRRHGDQLRQLPNGYYQVLGRVDDAMNLGGIKIGAAEIERVIAGITGITETAAIAVSTENGPSQLVICAVATEKLAKESVKSEMQKRINKHLNPLFKIYDVVFLEALPKTASNKIMRRNLRKNYLDNKLISS